MEKKVITVKELITIQKKQVGIAIGTGVLVVQKLLLITTLQKTQKT